MTSPARNADTRWHGLLSLLDVLLVPIIYPTAWLFKTMRRVGLHRLPRCRRILLAVGVFPIRDHYYEPRFDYRHARQRFSDPRNLAGINWNVPEQLDLLERFRFADEVANLRRDESAGLEFNLNNRTFESGDAEYWYQLIRLIKPRRIIEVGSGNSTLVAVAAIARNQDSDPNYSCKHICIEPYENPWLDGCPVTLVRERIEHLPAAYFEELDEGDVLFIDSSHVIRPQGDVLFEYLELLPTLRTGVIVHIHDIFSPRDYPREWVQDEVRLWNEQYLLEAFLSHNRNWKIVGALNFLHHQYPEKLRTVAPSLTSAREPGSFYIQRVAGDA
jgi:hypothetical protein